MRTAVREDSGQVTAIVVVSVAGLFLFAGLVIDGGLALAGKMRAADTAQEAARAACQQVDLPYLRGTHHMRLDAAAADATAHARVAAAGDGDQARIEVQDDRTHVTVTHIQRTQVLSLVGLGSLTTTASATAHIERGATTPWGADEASSP
ncbi:hypothetical protein GCM10010388_69790 [Streptomyces mauvecolor]